MHQKASSSPRAEFRPRRSHRKSRNGCLTCKQRRKKCDEKRPSCTLCEAGLRTCVYASDRLSPGSSEAGTTSRSSSYPSPPPSLHESFSSHLIPFTSTSNSTHHSSQVGSGNVGVTNVSNITDADLYLHFLNHTCKFAPAWDRQRIVLQVGIAKLALDSEPVSHSVLALSAACLCCDVIASGNADLEVVGRILARGLQHHTLALEQMRAMTSCLRKSHVQPLLANALLLAPFAFAFQNIRYWMAALPLPGGAAIAAANTVAPRDAVLLLRGIRTTIDALNNSNGVDRSGDDDDDDDDDNDNDEENKRRCLAPTTPWDTIFSSGTMDPGDDGFTASIPESSQHPMYPVLVCTFNQAMAQLHCRIQRALLVTCPVDEKTASTLKAFDILKGLMCDTFSLSDNRNSDPEEVLEHVAYGTKVSVVPDSLLAQAPGWLRSFVLRQPRLRPTTTHTYQGVPLARSFLAFFSNASKVYIDLLLPLLDPRTDGVDDDEDDEEDDNGERGLTAAEVLALDVYGHWLVLVFLMEKEAWWVGNFPYVALEGLISRYGDELLGTTGTASMIQEQWWPANMLEVAMRLRRSRKADY